MTTRIKTLRNYRMLALAVFATILAGASANAATGTTVSPMPNQYEYDNDDTPRSAACVKSFSGGVAVPKTVVSPHHYVLLLVFRNPRDSNRAGTKLFQADPPIGSEEGGHDTVGCLKDPEATTGPNGAAITDWGIKIKGSCPSDCTSLGLVNLMALDANRQAITDDPLQALGKKIQWGIFFAEPNGANSSHVRVWQIRVKGGKHAQEILDQLEKTHRLSQMRGYVGHFLVGYRPCLNDEAEACLPQNTSAAKSGATAN